MHSKAPKKCTKNAENALKMRKKCAKNALSAVKMRLGHKCVFWASLSLKKHCWQQSDGKITSLLVQHHFWSFWAPLRSHFEGGVLGHLSPHIDPRGNLMVSWTSRFGGKTQKMCKYAENAQERISPCFICKIVTFLREDFTVNPPNKWPAGVWDADFKPPEGGHLFGRYLLCKTKKKCLKKRGCCLLGRSFRGPPGGVSYLDTGMLQDAGHLLGGLHICLVCQKSKSKK